MSDEPPVTREEFEALRQRVAELETTPESDAEDDVTIPLTEGKSIDDRDKRVLSFMRANGKRSKRRLVRLYIAQTDIQDRKKAKRRAKNLERTEAYARL